jgi:hypothetical protein
MAVPHKIINERGRERKRERHATRLTFQPPVSFFFASCKFGWW